MAECRFAAGVGVVSYELEPLDVLFFRDGRPFDAAPRAATAGPIPQAIAGALRTWLLSYLNADFTALGSVIKRGGSFREATAMQSSAVSAVGRLGIRGPWFVKDHERLVPTPATIEVENGSGGALHRLDPLADGLPGWSPPANDMRPLWRRSRGATRARRGYIGRAALERFLSGSLPHADEIVDSDALFGFEDRVGIGVAPDAQTAGEGMIYSVRLMRLCRGVTLAVDLVGARDDLSVCPDDSDVLLLGGESRRAIVRRSPEVHSWPEASAGTADGRLVLLTTPAPFAGWRPHGLPVVAAAVPGNVPISGWDMARGGPKPNRFAVPAGSVYFCGRETGRANGADSLCSGEDAAVGWGTCLEGKWNYA